ncbi:MAG TPA: hypothetical protein EYP61_00425 [Candidatus Latescibacteria bacterium]|nr:hypothetical protein [Candidatus Latescibacterota bacterium]
MPRKLVPVGFWQATKVAEGGRLSLVGAPWPRHDFELGDWDELFGAFPEGRDLLARFRFGDS